MQYLVSSIEEGLFIDLLENDDSTSIPFFRLLLTSYMGPVVLNQGKLIEVSVFFQLSKRYLS